MTPRRNVRVADLVTARGEGVLTALGLGSCVAIVLWDPTTSAGGMAHVLLPSPPQLEVDVASAVLTPAFLRLRADAEYVFVVETEFVMQDLAERLRGFFLLLPDPPSLRAILRATRLA